MHFIVQALLVLVMLSALSAHTELVRYVKSTTAESCPCQPCLTLDQYTSYGTKYFTTGTAFLFLAGNHSIHSTLKLQHISDVILKRMENDFDVTVVCETAEVIIQCENVTNITLQGIAFKLYTGNLQGSSPSVLGIFDSREVLFHNLTFQGTADKTKRINAGHFR